jgi:ribosome-binding protein aMBF1 (putative translation factor)
LAGSVLRRISVRCPSATGAEHNQHVVTDGWPNIDHGTEPATDKASRKFSADGQKYWVRNPSPPWENVPMGRRVPDKRLDKAFAKAVQEAREHAGMTQKQLSEAAGIDRKYPALMARAEHLPSLDSVFHLAEGLGIPASRLIKMTEDRFRNPHGGHLRLTTQRTAK